MVRRFQTGRRGRNVRGNGRGIKERVREGLREGLGEEDAGGEVEEAEVERVGGRGLEEVAELGVGAADVLVHLGVGEGEVVGDLVVGFAGHLEVDDLALEGGELVDGEVETVEELVAGGVVLGGGGEDDGLEVFQVVTVLDLLVAEEGDAAVFGDGEEVLLDVEVGGKGVLGLHEGDEGVLGEVLGVVLVHDVVIDEVVYITVMFLEYAFYNLSVHILFPKTMDKYITKSQKRNPDVKYSNGRRGNRVWRGEAEGRGLTREGKKGGGKERVEKRKKAGEGNFFREKGGPLFRECVIGVKKRSYDED